MFDFLKKPTHHHPPSQKFNQEERPIQVQISPSQSTENIGFSVIPKILQQQLSRNNSKKPARVKKYQENSQVKLSKQVQHQLKNLLYQAEGTVKNLNANKIITNQMEVIQKRAFIRYTSSNEHQYLNKLFAKSIVDNFNVKQGLNNLIFGTVDSITDDIENNKYDYAVFKKKIMTKDQILQAEQMNQIHSIKKKEGQISSKVGQLRMELHIVQDPHIISKAKSIIEKDAYNKDNSKTKEVEKFIQLKKIQRQEIQRKKKEELDRKRIKQLQQKIIVQKQVEKAKSQRHAKLVEKLEAKQILKQKRNQQIESERERFTRFLKQYKKAKPLYQQKIQEQFKKQIQDKKLRFQRMSERKGNYNPISFAQIEDFEQKYLQLKRELQEKKSIQILIKKDEQKIRIQEMKDKHYKGKYRYLVLEEMVNREAKNKEEEFVKKLLLEKKRAYSVDIKQKYKPSIDEKKRMESQRFLAQNQMKTKHKGPRRVRLNSSDRYDLNTISYEDDEQKQQPDAKKEGEKNMRLFKQYIQQKMRKGQIKRPDTFESQISSYTPKIDYLKQQREQRETINTSFTYQSLDASSRIKKIKSQSNGDIGLFKMKAQQLDEKTRRQELRLKYSEHSPNDEKELQQNYLASIQAKLQLLNNVK